MLVRITWLVALLYLVSLAGAPSALAHASLLRSDPADGGSYASGPETITLWFSETIEPRYSRVELLRADGSRVSAAGLESVAGSGDPALRLPLREGLPRGSYTVVWSTLSAVDGHVSEGFFSFTVGDALPPSAGDEAALARAASAPAVPLPFDATVRWLNLLGETILAGTLIVILLALLPAWRAGAVAPPARRYRGLFVVALTSLFLGHLGAAIAQGMKVTRGGPLDALGQPLVALLTETRYGALWLARGALLVALAVAVMSLTRGGRFVRTSGNGRLIWGAALVVAALTLLTTSLGSHAAARDAGALAVLNDWVHLIGASVWLGALAALALALPLPEGGRSLALRRASALAVAAVAVLIVTGTIAARGQLVNWDGVVATRYGMWFTLKLALVAAALGFGAWRLLVVRPGLETTSSERVTPVARRFGHMLRMETLFALLVLVATALLTASIPARELLGSDARLFAATRLTAEAAVALSAAPGRIGANEFSVTITPHDEATFGTVQRVYLRFEPLAGGGKAGESGSGPATIGQQRVQLRQAGPMNPYSFRGAGSYLAMEGDWTVTAIVRRAGTRDLDVPFALTATDAGLYPSGIAPRGAVSGDGGSRATLLGLVWIAGGVALAIAGRSVRSRRVALARGLVALSALTLFVGSLLILSGGGVAAAW